MTERARWALLVLSLVLAVGGLAGTGILYTNSVQRHAREETARIEREAQQDLCDLLSVFDDPNAAPPTTERGRTQQAGLRAYRAKRC